MAKVKSYPAETKERARHWYAQGIGLTNIATRLGCGVSTVISWTAELRRQHPRKECDTPSSEARAEALRLARAGAGVAEIARQVGTPYQTVQYWIAKEGKDARAAQAALPPAKRYQITDPALALALSGAWR
jgi:transposase-like protein